MKAWTRLLQAASALAIVLASSVPTAAAAAAAAAVEPGFVRSQAPGPISIPLRQHVPQRSELEHGPAGIRPRGRSRSSKEEVVHWANTHRTHLRQKYRLPESSSPLRRDPQFDPTAVTSPAKAEVRMSNYRHDSSWIARVQIGTPPRSYNLLVDTGSSDCWLGAEKFQLSNSTTFLQTPNAIFDVQYGSGNVSGIMGHDVVRMGSGDVTFVSEKQVIAVASKITSSLSTSPQVAGIMGFAFESLAGVDAPPFWLQANISERRFGIYLQRQLTSLLNVSPDIFAPGGTLTLGGINSSLFVAGSENAVEVLERSYWLVLLDGLSAGNQQVNLRGRQRAAIDTGTTLIGGPDEVIAEMYSKIPGAEPMADAPGYYTYPCSARDIRASMAFGGKWYTLPDIDFVGDIASDDLSSCMGAFFGLGTLPTDNLQWIVGGAFLKNTYTIFDAGTGSGDDAKAQVIFAALAPGLNSGTHASDVGADGLATSPGVSRYVAGFFVATVAFSAVVVSGFI